MKTNLPPLPSLFPRFFTLCLLMSLFTVSVDAQSWALPSSRWEYYRTANHGIIDGYCCFRDVEKDTVLEGKVCAKLGDNFYTYGSGDTAYFYRNGAFRSTFYFSAHVGDTVQFYNDTTGVCCGSHYFSQMYLYGRVTSVYNLTSAGLTIKKFEIEGIDTTYFHIVYAERMGLFESCFKFYPTFEYGGDCGGEYMQVCNYGDSTLPDYWFYPIDCKTVGVEDIKADNNLLRCYPNPSSGTLTIDMSGFESGVKVLHVYDQLGRSVYSGETSRSEVTLVLQLASGMYGVEVMSEGRFGRAKLLVE